MIHTFLFKKKPPSVSFEEAKKIVTHLVTPDMVDDNLNRLIDERIISTVLTQKDIQMIIKQLPSRVYKQCLKTNKTSVLAMGDYADQLIRERTTEILIVLLGVET